MSILKKDEDLKFPQFLVLEASAGSGKTFALAKRFVQFILSDKISHNKLKNILAITFTNNATKEMKERILIWLKKLALNIDCEEKKQTLEVLTLNEKELRKKANNIIDEIIENYSDFKVQTIDSFFNKVLNASTLELGLPPEVEMTFSNAELIKYAVDEVLKDLGINQKSNENALEFLKLLNEMQISDGSFNWNPVTEIIKEFDSFLKEEAKMLEEIKFGESNEQYEKVKTEIFKEVKTFYDFIKPYVNNPFELNGQNQHYNTLFNIFNNNKIQEIFFWLIDLNITPKTCPLVKGKIKDKKHLEILEEIKQKWVALIQQKQKAIEIYSATKYSPYKIFYNDFKNTLNELKSDLAQIHISDMNKKLSEYLKDNVPEIYFTLGDIIYHYLIDEFQDTSKIHWENLKPLLENSLSEGGSVFVVGDLKQGIFMFNNADYTIMANLINDIIRVKNNQQSQNWLPQSVKQPEANHLGINYRSGGQILNYVDEIFKENLKNKVGPESEILTEDRSKLTVYEQKPLAKIQDEGYVETKIITKEEISQAEEKGEIAEKNILNLILEDVLKRYNYKDIAILTGKNETVEEIIEWLTEKKHSATSYSSLDLRKRKVVMEIVSLLKFLESPTDNLSFATFILGKIFLKSAKEINQEISKEEIQNFIFETKKTYHNAYLYIKFKEKYENLWGTLFESLYQKIDFYPIYDLLILIYQNFNLFNNFDNEESFLVKFLEVVNSLETQGINSLRDLLEIVIKTDKETEELFSINLPEVNAVKVMTFFKAKGLGFPVVINLFYPFNNFSENMFFEKEEDKAKILYIIKDYGNVSEKLKKIHSEGELKSIIQNLNTIYVANTRAKKELYNILKSGRGNTNWMNLFSDKNVGQKYQQAKKEIPALQTTNAIIPEISTLTFVSKEQQIWTEKRILEVKKGDLIHKVLSKIKFIDNKISETIEILTTNTMKELNCDFNITEIISKISDSINTPAVKIWFEEKPLRNILNEQEFVSKEGYLYIMDRIIIDENQITIIDFKLEKKHKKYYEQLRNYKNILAEIYPAKTITAYLAFIKEKQIEEVKSE